MVLPSELGIEKNTGKLRKYAKMIKNVYYPVFAPTVTNIDALAFVSSFGVSEKIWLDF
jgi:hypothetical protein